MKHVAVNLAVFAKSPVLFVSQNEFKRIGLGCKRSWVQIPPRRPAYLIVNTGLFLINTLEFFWPICALKCSKTQEKEGVVGGKIGVLPRLSSFRFQSALIQSRNTLQILSSAHFIANFIANIQTTSRHIFGGRHGFQKQLVQTLQ